MKSQKGCKPLNGLTKRASYNYRTRIFPKIYGCIAQAILELLDIYYDDGIHAERVPKKIFGSLVLPPQLKCGDLKSYSKIVIEDLKAYGLIQQTQNNLKPKRLND